MGLTQAQISEELYEEDKWGTKAEYKRERKRVPWSAMKREIDRGEIAVRFDAVDGKIKMNFRQADTIFGFSNSGLFE